MKNQYTVYSENSDMTFIMEDTVSHETGEILTTECIGFHYGEPDADSIRVYGNREMIARF